MKVLSPGKFQILLQGKEREILVPFGLRAEIYKLISVRQVEFYNASKKNLIPDDVKEDVERAKVNLEKLETAAEKDEAAITAAKSELNTIYEQAMLHIERNSQALAEQLAKKQADLVSSASAEALALLLSERDEYGKIVTPVSAEEIQWSPKYADDQDELLALLEAVTAYITESLKKVSNVGTMIAAVSVGSVK